MQLNNKTSADSNLKATLSTLVSSHLVILLTFASGVILARFLGPEHKGNYNGLRLLLYFYGVAFTFGYPGGFLFYSLKGRLNALTQFLPSLVLISILGLAAIPILGLLSQNRAFGELLSELDIRDLYLALLATPLIFSNYLCLAFFNSRRQFHVTNKRVTLSALFLLIFYAVASALGSLSLKMAIIGLLAAEVVQLIFNLKHALGLIAGNIKPAVLADTLLPFNMGIRDWFATTIAQAGDKLDQVILAFFLLPTEFGIYGAGMAVANLASPISLAFLNVFFAEVTSKPFEDGKSILLTTIRIATLVCALLSTLVAMLSYYLVSIIFGEAYIRAWNVALLYTPGVLFQILTRYITKWYASQGRPFRNAQINLISILVSLPLYFALIPKWGINGAAICSTFTYLLAYLAALRFLRVDFGVVISPFSMPKPSDVVMFRQLLGSKLSN